MSALPAGEPMSVDPFRPAPDGRYVDEAVVVVRRRPMALAGPERWVGRTTHFGIGRLGGRLLVVHGLGTTSVSADVSALVADELFAPGWVVGADAFESIVTGVVLTCHEDPGTAWEAFYRNTLYRLAELTDGTRAGSGTAGAGTLAEFAPIYLRAEALVAQTGARSLLDLGSCFGFLPLRVADGRAGAVRDVLACDVAPGTARLLDVMSRRLGTPVRTMASDAARVPLPDAAVDVVTVLHLLEHVDAAHGARILAEATRLARRRVVVAVPIEDDADPTFGHVRTIGLDDLRRAGEPLRANGWAARVDEHHGGWLVLDRL
ncbi:MAG: methyltransferase domain-containing protein [Actinobacteria bacterium]|nr:methyltransferase domain-containing protein [Actinomycetota bacterium]